MIIDKIDEYLNEAKFTDDNAMYSVVASLLAAVNFGMELKLINDNYVKVENNKISIDKLGKKSIEQHYYSWSPEDDNAFNVEYNYWLKTVKKEGIKKVLSYVDSDLKKIIERLVEKE